MQSKVNIHEVSEFDITNAYILTKSQVVKTIHFSLQDKLDVTFTYSETDNFICTSH